MALFIDFEYQVLSPKRTGPADLVKLIARFEERLKSEDTVISISDIREGEKFLIDVGEKLYILEVVNRIYDLREKEGPSFKILVMEK